MPRFTPLEIELINALRSIAGLSDDNAVNNVVEIAEEAIAKAYGFDECPDCNGNPVNWCETCGERSSGEQVPA